MEDMNDLISRQAVIDAIDQYYKDKKYIARSRTILSAICLDMKSIMEDLPSADRPQGEWKPFDRTWGRETWYCTNCKDAVANMPTIMGSAIYKYCPNCGARMKGAAMMINDLRNKLKPCPFCGRKVNLVSLQMGSDIGVTRMDIECACGISFEIYADDVIYSDGTPHQIGLTALDKWERRIESDE